MQRDIYSGRLKLNGKQHARTLGAAFNYALSFLALGRFEEARSVVRKWIPVARRVLGEGNGLTLKMRSAYAEAIYKDASSTLDDLREAETTLEDTRRIARRVLGSAHPLTVDIETCLRFSRAALRAREETASSSA